MSWHDWRLWAALAMVPLGIVAYIGYGLAKGSE